MPLTKLQLKLEKKAEIIYLEAKKTKTKQNKKGTA